MKNLDIQGEKAWHKARAKLARRGGASNEPDPQKAFHELKRLYDDDPLPEDEVLIFDQGAHFTLDDGVFDLHATPTLPSGRGTEPFPSLSHFHRY